MRHPNPVKEGSTIGIFAPAGRVDQNLIEEGLSLLNRNGFDVFVHPQTYIQNHQMAGTPQQKAEAFNDLLREDDINIIMAARGGNQAPQILPHLDKKLISNSTKTLIGFSDFTYLLNAFYKNNFTLIHGPMAQTLSSTNSDDVTVFLNYLKGQDVSAAFNQRFSDAQTLVKGTAEGKLYGGCLPLIQTLLGTEDSPFNQGGDFILFLEDFYEEISRWDRMLYHLKCALDKGRLKGLIFGNFAKGLDSGDPFGYAINEIIENHFVDAGIPVIVNAPFGHGEDNLFMPINSSIILSANDDKPLIKLK